MKQVFVSLELNTIGFYSIRVMSEADHSHTTLWVSRETASQLREMKPFDSLTWDEWLAELADHYEDNT